MVATTPEADALWAAYRACRSTENRNALVEMYLPLTARYVCRYRVAWVIEKGDVEQWANIALIRAVEKFDASKGTKFRNYLTKLVRCAIVDGFRATYGRRRPDGSLPIRPERLDRRSWLAAPESPDETCLRDFYAWAMLGLSDLQRHVLYLRFNGGKTIDETAGCWV